MRKLYVCGKRGMGDMLQGVSEVLHYMNDNKGDYHVVFHYPPNLGREATVHSLINCFEETSSTYSYEVDTSWFTIKFDQAEKRFEGLRYNHDWFFSGIAHVRPYYNFKTKWKPSSSQRICLALNHEEFNPQHPIQGKFFTEYENMKLQEYVDNKNVFELGKPRTLEECVELIKDCKTVIGIEGGWTHLTHSMHAPYVLFENKRKHASIKLHRGHYRLTIASENVLDYMENMLSNDTKQT